MDKRNPTLPPTIFEEHHEPFECLGYLRENPRPDIEFFGLNFQGAEKATESFWCSWAGMGWDEYWAEKVVEKDRKKIYLTYFLSPPYSENCRDEKRDFWHLSEHIFVELPDDEFHQDWREFEIPNWDGFNYHPLHPVPSLVDTTKLK